MLVLTRRNQQQIRIGDNITVTVLRVRGNAVRVGIEAPSEVRVVRGELTAFEAMENDRAGLDASESDASGDGAADREAAVSDLQWVAMRKLQRRRPCLPVRRCLAKRRQPEPTSDLTSTANMSGVFQ